MLILSNKDHTTNSGFLRLESKQELKSLSFRFGFVDCTDLVSKNLRQAFCYEIAASATKTLIRKSKRPLYDTHIKA